MPAVNTPQFSWVLSRLPNHALPVPPTYQPELAARAVVYAAEHPRRREYWVGTSTVATLAANAIAPACSSAPAPRTGFTRTHDPSCGIPSTIPRWPSSPRWLQALALPSGAGIVAEAQRPLGSRSCPTCPPVLTTRDAR